MHRRKNTIIDVPTGMFTLCFTAYISPLKTFLMIVNEPVTLDYKSRLATFFPLFSYQEE